MKVSVLGTGYVGLVAGAGFAEIGHSVRCVDIDTRKIDALKEGKIPIHEPGLDEMFERNCRAGRLTFSTEVAEAVACADVVVIAVGTPEKKDGSADISAVLSAAEIVGDNIDGFTVVACKSTVPVGTNEKVRETIASRTDQPFAVVSNPEFLREGEAIQDFMHPARVVIGTDDRRAEEIMRSLYAPLYGYYDARERIICMDPRSAEMTKYVANAFLATRITFINEVANLCEAAGADITKVRLGAGTDPRIGLNYFYPGCGYGGSCFPKDVKALLRTARIHERELRVLEAVDSANDVQKLVPFEKVKRCFGGDLAGKKIAIWGLAFKPETDDVRESPAIYVARALVDAGASVRVHDPIAISNFKQIGISGVHYFDDMYSAIDKADALLILTEWADYKGADTEKVASMLSGDVVVDGRNAWIDRKRPSGLRYEPVGVGAVRAGQS